MNLEAIFSDETVQFQQQKVEAQNSSVIVKLRVYSGDKIEAYAHTNTASYRMELDKVVGNFSLFKTEIPISNRRVSYYFEIKGAGESFYYDKYGVSDSVRDGYFFNVCPSFDVPDWSKGAVMYQILVDRFAKGDDSTSVKDGEYFYIDSQVHKKEDWEALPESFDVGNFFGGDLVGVSQKLKYLKSLGVEVIYFNPLFVSPSNHKYDAQDYDYIDPHFTVIPFDYGKCLEDGEDDNKKAERYINRVTNKDNLEASNKFFIEFVKAAHEHGIRIILDGVFNHCGSFHKWMDRERLYAGREGYPSGAYGNISSPYRDYFSFEKKGNIEDAYKYDGWWGHDTLPKLNYEGSEKLCENILEIAKKWVSPPYNVDGWRLDVAADLGKSLDFNHKFWKRFRSAVKEANPNAVILAEHYGDARDWLQGDEWDTVMNYDAFMEPVTYFLTGMEKHSDSFEESALGDGKRFEHAMKHAMSSFMSPSLLCAMNQLSNHDHSRFLTRTNKKVGRIDTLGSEAAAEDVDYNVFRLGVLLQMTLPGAPTLYYGDEAGVVGFTDPDSRRTYPWGKEKLELIDYYRDCISVHKYNNSLKAGSFVFLETDKDYISFARFTENEASIIVINSGSEIVTKHIPVWKAQIPGNSTLRRLIVTNENGYSILPKELNVIGGYLEITLKPKSGVVYKWE